MIKGKILLLTLVAVITVLGISNTGYCHQLEIKEKGELGFSWYLNVEYGYTHTDYNQTAADFDTSDIYVDELGLAFSAGLTKSITADALILYEEAEEDAGNDSVVIDEGYLSIVCPHTGIWFAHFGKMYLPFADAESSFVTDPYTHDLGETRESVFSLGAKWNMIDFEIGTFNGDSDKLGDNNDNTDDYYASLEITPVDSDVMTLTISAAYMSDITDTDWNILDVPTTALGYTDKVGAYSLWLVTEAKTGKILIEYVAAVDKLDKDLGPTMDKPTALNVEIVGTFLKKHTFGLKYESSDEFTTLVAGGDTGIQRVGILSGYEIHEKVTFNIEYITAKDDKTDNKVDTVKAQLALEF